VTAATAGSAIASLRRAPKSATHPKARPIAIVTTIVVVVPPSAPPTA
jgi:hypothetical protein